MNVVPMNPAPSPQGFLNGFSIEVMPRTAAKIPDFTAQFDCQSGAPLDRLSQFKS